MNIIYLTDIHGSFNKVSRLFDYTSADIYLLAGDLIDIPFFNIDTAITYHDLQTKMKGLRSNMNQNDDILENFVDKLMEIPDISPEILDSGTQYQKYTIRARRVMQQKYRVLENIITFQPNVKTFVLAGNYDMDLKFTALHERDLHLKWYTINGFKIAGYGGADVWTNGIPEKYIIPYKAGLGINDKSNELYKFFNAIQPDIIVAHQPPNGILDYLSYRGASGSPALRNYCDNNNMTLCLSGHIHSSWGCELHENAIFLNPSNFGEVTTAQGEISEGGFFFDIHFNPDNSIHAIYFKKILDDNNIVTIAEYAIINNELKTGIIDENRYTARKIRKNFDYKTASYTHIPDIKLINDLKLHFAQFFNKDIEQDQTVIELAFSNLPQKSKTFALDIIRYNDMNKNNVKIKKIQCTIYTTEEHQYTTHGDKCPVCIEKIKPLQKALGNSLELEIVDSINLFRVQQSILVNNYECRMTQKFIAYRAIGKPINFSMIYETESILNKNIEFKKELEGSIRTYILIFVNTFHHSQTFEEYEQQLIEQNIEIPQYIKNILKNYIQQTGTLHEVKIM